MFTEFNSVGKRCNLQRALGKKSLEEKFMSAQDSDWDCECSDVSADSEEDGGDQEDAEDEEN